LNFEIEGDESLRKFVINSNLENKNVESFNANGSFEIINKETILDLKLNSKSSILLNSLGGEVLSNIRGSISGNASIEGNLKKYQWAFVLNDAGLTVPYLNVDYALSDTIIDLTDENFIQEQHTNRYQITKGQLNGNIEHNNFADWKLDLAINSKDFGIRYPRVKMQRITVLLLLMEWPPLKENEFFVYKSGCKI
jgi:hypothetical protein